MTDIKQILEFAQSIARSAGAIMVTELLKHGGPESHYKFAGTELVTEADIKVDKLICDAIRHQFPGHLILAEESAPDLAGLSQIAAPLWIIDPIDGTVNYAHDHGQSAVSIAYIEHGQVQCGVVFNPFAHEMFYATRGQGAFLNGAPIHVDNCADLRRLGSAALDICWVAMGRLDIYYENLSVWDFAAAQLIAQEAGASYGHFQPVPAGVNPVFHNKNILVSNAELYEQARRLLQQADSA
jgi:myo-inositol-1(or 4)-monophosphatase